MGGGGERQGTRGPWGDRYVKARRINMLNGFKSCLFSFQTRERETKKLKHRVTSPTFQCQEF